MNANTPGVVYIVPDKLGGVFTATANLLENLPRDAFTRHIVLTRDLSSREPRSAVIGSGDSRSVVDYMLPPENLWAVIRRIIRAVPAGPGVIVIGDLLDVAVTSVHDFGRAVVMVVHGSGDYYLDLAATHERTIHAFIGCSAFIAERLRIRLPHRAADIHHIPHGVPTARFVRKSADGPLRAAFVGRIDSHKGVLDLPQIAAAARTRGASIRWTVIGAGPSEEQLRNDWNREDVRYLGPLSPDRTLQALAEQDVFVLPTRTEGFPIALLEAMNAGVVPIVTDLDSGIPEIVTTGKDGFRVPQNETVMFAERLAALDCDRPLLEACSARARETIAARFTIEGCVAQHCAIYSRYAELYRPLAGRARLRYGSRLDKPWIPNSVVRAIRLSRSRRPVA